MKQLVQIKPVSWIKFALYGLLLLGIYYSTFTWLVTHDWEKEAYSLLLADSADSVVFDLAQT